jgi:hypothetical protein
VDVAGLEKEAFHDDSRAIPHGVRVEMDRK